ncbi:hypothetical protein Mame01_01510 [Microbispora amethystogenes]|nr:hypothetical protein Mame01_01510 [Microbispora amethystogenes]
MLLGLASTTTTAAAADTDPRVGLGAGWLDAQEAASNVQLLTHLDKPEGFVQPSNPGNASYANSDLAFAGDYAFSGNYQGFNIYDISNGGSPVLKTSVICPGGQGDLSVYGNLLFMSVEETRGRVDCGTQGASGTVNPDRFRGVRVFDISDISRPVQVAAVQTCRGSHTHSLVTSKNEPENVYVYVSGTAGVRSGQELAGCANTAATDPGTSLWRIDVIRVPLAAPQNAAVVSQPRLFADAATGAVNGLQNTPPTQQHPSGTNWSPQPVTNHCHDITAYPEIGLAAGACAGNGILIDISDPSNPKRLDAVSDPNYAYWHSATFNNDGTKVVFTDEWGGGSGARCRVTDEPSWGANAIYDIVGGKLQFRSYYKLPAPQTTTENCVAHNGSLVPVPGRDIMVQAWYQGGLSAFDFTDSRNPKEIAFFDRGPISATSLALGGYWSAYWYNGHIYGNEIARGFDAFKLTPSQFLDQAEINAAASVRLGKFNTQAQPKLTWEPSFDLVRARYAQASRTGKMSKGAATSVKAAIDLAEQLSRKSQWQAASALLLGAATLPLKKSDPEQAALIQALKDLAKALIAKQPADRTAPVTSVTTDPARPAGGWFTGQVKVTLTAADEAKGSGLDRTEYKLDGGAWTRYTAPVVLSGDGAHALAYRSADKAGNVEEIRTVTARIDATAPVTTSTVPPANDGGEHDGDVQVTLSATDETSGTARTEYALDAGDWTPYAGPVTVSGPGEHELRYRSADKAGNVEEAKAVKLTIATPAPRVPLTVTASSRCVGTSAYVAVTAVNDAEVPATVTLTTPFGAKTVEGVAPAKQAYQSFNSRAGQLAAGTVTVTGTATIGGKQGTTSYEAAYNAISCA